MSLLPMPHRKDVDDGVTTLSIAVETDILVEMEILHGLVRPLSSCSPGNSALAAESTRTQTRWSIFVTCTLYHSARHIVVVAS